MFAGMEHGVIKNVFNGFLWKNPTWWRKGMAKLLYCRKKIVDKTEIVQISVKDGGRGVGPYSLKLGAI